MPSEYLIFLELTLFQKKKNESKTNKKNNSVALGQGPGSPSMDAHNIFELFFRYRNPN